ncbi:alkane hydroxylase MAH1-like [Papaver somniferum]|uniref:alkane hydroxylase MAH1-like n=1 Tax=Papaver somniferum TaxID=3469 RepID=UPI000E6FEE30|nr:alkane hydroxylase MAH1-like [Papaver somniferum]
MAHTAFTATEFKDLLSSTSLKVVEEQLVPLLAHVAKTGSPVDLQEVCSRFAFVISMNATFGLMRLFNIGWERECTKALKIIEARFYQLISQKRNDMLRGIKSFDLLSSHIKAREQISTNISSLPTKNDDKFLRDTMLSLFAAGNDAVSSGLIWFFWLVFKTPVVEAKILEELKLLFPRKRDFDARNLSGLVYLHAAICESLRLYPPIPLNGKTALKEVVLPDGSLVKQGMQIIISNYSVGRMSWIWGEDCLEFKPERWIDDNGKLIRHGNMSKFVSFNLGPRTCLGKDMAFTQIKAVAATVLFNFQVEVLEGQHSSLKPAFTLHMEKGLKVKLQKRVI